MVKLQKLLVFTTSSPQGDLCARDSCGCPGSSALLPALTSTARCVSSAAAGSLSLLYPGHAHITLCSRGLQVLGFNAQPPDLTWDAQSSVWCPAPHPEV